MTHVKLNVPDISCEHCEHAITEALGPVRGILTVQVDLPRKEVDLDYDESVVSLDQVEQILAEEDYPVASAR